MQREAELETELDRVSRLSDVRIDELESTVAQLQHALAEVTAKEKALRAETETLREDKMRITAKANSLQDVGIRRLSSVCLSSG